MTVHCFGWRGIAIVLMFSQSCSMGQTSKAKSPARTPLSEEKQSVRKTVQAFLNSWLVSRDLDSAKLWFGAAAFLNEAMLQESCAGYIKPEQRSSEAARRIGIDKFLQDFLPAKQVARLSQVINQNSVAQMAEELSANLANDARSDGFVLAKLTREQLPVSAAEFKDYLRSRLSDEFYASFVPIGEGTVYFLWIREGQVWRILHASLVCA